MHLGLQGVARGRAVGQLRRHDLDGYGEPLVTMDPTPDLGHAAATDNAVELKGSEGYGREGHGW